MNNQPKILVIDDDPTVSAAVQILLASENYQLFFESDGIHGLAKVIDLEPDVILLDVMLPGFNGFDVCRQIRALPTMADVPILMISTLDDQESRITGIQNGADDYISKPFNGLELKARLGTLTRLNRFRRLVEQRNEVNRLHNELLYAYDKTIEGWSNALDLRDKETEGHTQRVTELTLQLARKLGLPEEMMIHIWRGAMLHDVGKLGIPDSILLKPGKLTDEEWAIMKRHPIYAYEWLNKIDYLRPALDIPYSHHEKWNGEGYPNGLKGKEIPVVARAFAIVDVWDAITSDRPYHSAMSVDDARAHILNNAGSHFDPEIVDVFLSLS